jgi:hypothetical protein
VGLLGKRGVRRLVGTRFASHPIGFGQARHSGLQANGAIAGGAILERLLDGVLDGFPVGMTVDHDTLATGAAQQLIQGQPRDLALDVPQRHVDRGDRRHRHRATAPVGAAVQVLPGVFDPMCVAADQAGHDMILEITANGQLASVQGRIAQAVQTIVGDDFQRDEITSRTTDDDARFFDYRHGRSPL